MDLSFTEEQAALRDVARQLLSAHTTQDRLREVAAGDERIDRALWAEMARAGLLGVGIPEELGGIGGGLMEACVVLEEIGRHTAPVPYLTSVVSALTLAACNDQAWLPRIASGDAIVTTAFGTEHVPAAHVAAAILLAGSDGVELSEDFDVERQVATTGEIHGIVALRGRTRIGDATSFARDVATVAWCAVAVGVCDRALRLTASYVSEREQFGRPLGSFQAVQQRIGDTYIDVEAMRWTMWQAAFRVATGAPAEQEVAIAKFWAADAGQRVVSAAQHLHGGVGVDVEYPLHRYTLWAKLAELMLGSAQPQLVALGDLIAGGA